jgi:hypothetical protein
MVSVFAIISRVFSETWLVYAMRWAGRTYGEVWGRGPGGLAVDIADEGPVDVAGANEAVARRLEKFSPAKIE